MTATALCPPRWAGRSPAQPGGGPRPVSALAGPHAPASPDAAAAIDRLRATAARTLSEHVGRDGTCTRCRLPWPCDRAHLADCALGAG
jgi:hypothetical protein